MISSLKLFSLVCNLNLILFHILLFFLFFLFNTYLCTFYRLLFMHRVYHVIHLPVLLLPLFRDYLPSSCCSSSPWHKQLHKCPIYQIWTLMDSQLLVLRGGFGGGCCISVLLVTSIHTQSHTFHSITNSY